MMNIYEIEFLFALLKTVSLELAVFLIYFCVKNRDFNSLKDKIIIGIIPSVLTLPYLWFILPVFLQNRSQFILVGETGVFLIEGLIYYCLLKMKLRDAMLLSFLCNLSSFLFGKLF